MTTYTLGISNLEICHDVARNGALFFDWNTQSFLRSSDPVDMEQRPDNARFIATRRSSPFRVDRLAWRANDSV